MRRLTTPVFMIPAALFAALGFAAFSIIISLQLFSKDAVSQQYPTDSTIGFDVVIAAGAVNCALNKTMDGLLKYLLPAPPTQFHIILPPQLVDICQELYPSTIVNCVDQDSVLPLSLNDVQNVLGEKGGLWPMLGNRAGWYHQQLLKLFAFRSLAVTPKFAIWDADLVLTAPFELIDSQNRVSIPTAGHSNNIYNVTTTALLSYPCPRSDTVSHFMGVEKRHLRQLFDVLCPNEELNDLAACATRILRQIPADQPATYTEHPEQYAFSEYTLYHAWVLQNANESVALRSDIKQKRLRKKLITGECSIPPGVQDMVVLENFRAGTPETLSNKVPKNYETPNVNYIKAFLDTAEQPECKHSKTFVEKIKTRWYCLDDIQPDNCTIYSFGIANQWDFDDFFHEYGCTVYSYDPSNGYKKHKRGERHFFDSIGLGVEDGAQKGDSISYGGKKEYEVRTFQSLMKQNGDTFIDILRIDIEGAEWGLLGSLIEDNAFDKVRYFSAELHMWEKRGYHEYFYHYLSGIPMKLFWQSQNTDRVNKETRRELSPHVTRVYEVLWGRTTNLNTTLEWHPTKETPYEVCFVTSSFGTSQQFADRPLSVQEMKDVNPTFRFYAFTNLPDLDAPGWTLIVQNYTQYRRFITQSRWPKFMAWKDDQVGGCQAVFYIDAFYGPSRRSAAYKFRRLAKSIKESKFGLAQNIHRLGGNAFTEFDRIITNRKDIRANVDASKAWLIAQPDFRTNAKVYENMVMGYDPKSRHYQTATQFLWDRYSLELESWRDQPLWSYALDRYNITPMQLDPKLFVNDIRRKRRGGHKYSEKEDNDAVTSNNSSLEKD